MSSAEITKNTDVAKVPATDTRQEIAVRPGLYLIIQAKPSAARSWAVRYRRHRKIRKLTLGPCSEIPLKDAISEANSIRADVRDGKDPAAERQERLAVPMDTVEILIERFRREHVDKKRKNTQREYNSYIDRFILPAWGRSRIGEITRKDIYAVRDRAFKNGAVTSIRVVSLISTFFKFCVNELVIDNNPAQHIPLKYREEPRERNLTDEELVAIWNAAGDVGEDGVMGYPWGPWVRLLMLTGARRTEVAGMRWSEFRQEDDGQVTWVIPKARYKTNQNHEVPITTTAWDIIQSIPQQGDCDFMFTVTGTGHVNGYSRPKARLDELSGVTGWTFHDIRRTVLTAMRRDLKISRLDAGAVLGHKPRGVTAEVYDQWSMIDEKRAALEKWSRRLMYLVNGTEDDDVVVPLRV
ncbi:MAG: integrase arm-type DNA-binding domain-containing protein [Rhodospirillaceae bacterium]|nr:integrase arm-type DNA-binding domain-containing protein [Rhodospirillaceae bacterium]MBT5081712.1 integrase arm-type DNA-binding domain-containing protein [Rhodospirillaceae bacterium]MBT5527426.1 integrase arm-type DNA-binding domain-containing protein [Rhodospirillaceae bacterium]MBT5880715.1 integrase arm-type DNA-binding domain-containing protein [Rhodospirillaceae bacterium]MBT6588490.1 integrase arm-type DNA-binding domain-containing protein [Rhodospirillaceae bacterium]